MQSCFREVEDIRERGSNTNKYISVDNVALKTLQISGPSFCLYDTKYTLQLNNCHIWKLECISLVLYSYFESQKEMSKEILSCQSV